MRGKHIYNPDKALYLLLIYILCALVVFGCSKKKQQIKRSLYYYVAAHSQNLWNNYVRNSQLKQALQ